MKIALISLLLLSPVMAVAQSCYDGIPETTPIARFTVNTDGTISDSVTGLMWQSCSYGQTYNNDSGLCENNALKITWQEALRGAVNDRTGNYSDWQVPSIKELASILEHRCVTPSINESVFKGNKSENYWTNTSGIADKTFAWVYQFDKGLNSLHAKTSNVYLRFVRYEK